MAEQRSHGIVSGDSVVKMTVRLFTKVINILKVIKILKVSRPILSCTN